MIRGTSRRPGPTRRDLLGTGGALVAALSGCLGSPAADTGTETTTPAESLSVTSPALEAGEQVPTAFTCDGADRSPPLEIGDVPEDAGALAVVVDDPDAPGGTFTHWLLWNLPPDRTSIPENVPAEPVVDSLGGARQGANDFGDTGYGGPCPPSGEVHTYRFTASALDGPLEVDPGASPDTVLPAIEDSRIGVGRLRAEYG